MEYFSDFWNLLSLNIAKNVEYELITYNIGEKYPLPTTDNRTHGLEWNGNSFQKKGRKELSFDCSVQQLYRSRSKRKSRSVIEFYVKNPEVTVLMHVPLYSSSEIFSHVGGLLGCWLGISVFIFTGIMEKFFRKVFKWRKRFGRRKKKRASTSEIHQY
ncbi:hypothetical protein AVEN_148420-1 [Araneus ventricosus]|uniref:Uncharacterized protein n=1 Tax=Araneus ventricosus TaxID=182803 RepID=A0A4Y2P1L5_ARAVE|nr:hypothetical protein AVEN_148420-1 [Araneus ventricosus]